MKKKLLALFMAGIMVMGTAACGKEESAKAESNGTADSGDREKFTVTFIQNEWHGDPNEMEIFKKLEELAGIKKEGRTVGSRTTRHHAASSMLRAGIPMSDISAALGHRDPNIVSVYLSTDVRSLCACTLPLPPVRKGGVSDAR